VLDVSQPLAPVVVTNLLVEPDSGKWRASFMPAAGDARYSQPKPAACWSRWH